MLPNYLRAEPPDGDQDMISAIATRAPTIRWSRLHSRRVGALALLMMVLGVTTAHSQRTAPVGSWRGTSTCVDKEHWPACHDEQAIYDARSKPGAPDTVTLRAYKLVNGERDFMGESDFALAADGSWVSEFPMGRSQGRMTIHIVGTHMTGVLVDVPSGRRVREVALDAVR